MLGLLDLIGELQTCAVDPYGDLLEGVDGFLDCLDLGDRFSLVLMEQDGGLDAFGRELSVTRKFLQEAEHARESGVLTFACDGGDFGDVGVEAAQGAL